MSSKLIRWSLVAVFSVVSTAGYTNPIHIPMAPGGVTAPNNIRAGSQYFDASVSGIGEYMEALRADNKKLYVDLLPSYDSLQRKQTISRITTWGMAGVGATLFFGSISFLQTTNEGSDYKSVNNTALMLGMGIGVGSFLSYWLLSPGRKDIMKFVNEHNRYSPQAPLDFRLGLAPSHRGMMAAMSLSF